MIEFEFEFDYALLASSGAAESLHATGVDGLRAGAARSRIKRSAKANQRAVYPPSITSSDPVTNFASSEAR